MSAMKSHITGAVFLAHSILLPLAALPPTVLPPAPDLKFGTVDKKLLAEAEAVDQHLEQEGFIDNNRVAAAQLNEMAVQLVADCPFLPNVKWQVRILRDPLINAFALPNGSIYLNSGLMGTLENEAQLAGVVAHEIIHVRNRHGYQSFRSYRKKAIAWNILSLASSVTLGGTAIGASVRAVAASSQVLLEYSILGYSRDLEREADMGSLILVGKTKYDSRQIPRVFEVLDERLEPRITKTFLSDHPALLERRKYTADELQIHPLDGRDGIDPGTYLDSFAPVILDDIKVEIDSRRYRTAIDRAERLVRWKPNSDHFYWLGEAYRALGARSPQPAPEELSDNSQAAALRRLEKLTIQEENAFHEREQGGQEKLKLSEAKAEEFYLKAAAAGTPNPRAYLGLGLLYEKQSRTEEARAAFRKYLAGLPNAPDRRRVQRRLEVLEDVR